MSKYLFILFISLTALLLSNFRSKKEIRVATVTDVNNLSVDNLLILLDNKSTRTDQLETFDPAKAAMGKDLVFNGQTKKKGRKSHLISPYFKCTDCHSFSKESATMSDLSAEARFSFSFKNKTPFFPGSTMFGVYNRSGFYEGDYRKKYGSIIDSAKYSLRKSIQVCSKYCSSGRFLDQWEEDAIFHYFKSQELKVSDLDVPQEMKEKILNVETLSVQEKNDLTAQLNVLYPQEFKATFLGAMDRNKRKYGEGGNPQVGEALYEASCMHCHSQSRVTYLGLEKDKLSAKLFLKNMKTYNDYSLYQIIRYGTYAKTGRKQYMPLYTKEKMSDDQINDLISYLKLLASKY